MPHCIVEYSKTLEQQVTAQILVNTTHQAAIQSALFDVSHIKTRAIAYDDFRLGSEHTNFIHVTIRQHQGRSNKQKQMLSSLVCDSLIALKLFNVSITVEVVDMDTESYSKHTG